MSTLTPEQKDALQYYNKLLKLTPGIKEAKRSSLPSTAKYNGDVTKFKEFRNAVEGHYRQQQASYLFNKEFVKQYTEHGASCYVNFAGVNSEGC